MGISLCQTHLLLPRRLQHTGPPGTLHSCRAQTCLFLHAVREDSSGYQSMGWLIKPSTAVLSSGWAARIYLYSLTTAAATSFLRRCSSEKKQLTVLMEQSKEAGAKQSNLSYQLLSSAMKNTRGFPSPGHFHFLCSTLTKPESQCTRVRTVLQGGWGSSDCCLALQGSGCWTRWSWRVPSSGSILGMAKLFFRTVFPYSNSVILGVQVKKGRWARAKGFFIIIIVLRFKL